MEFREIIDLPSTLLYLEDLEELGKIIKDDETNVDETLDIELSYNEKKIRYKSINELLNTKNLLKSTNRLFISNLVAMKYEENNRIKGHIDLTMSYNNINLYISSTNEDWFNGKKTRIIKFFNDKKPWYAIINKIAPIFPSISLLFLFYFIGLINDHEYFLSTIPLLFCVFFIIITRLSFKQKLFPYIKIIFQKKSENKWDINKTIALIGVIQIIIMLIQIILMKHVK